MRAKRKVASEWFSKAADEELPNQPDTTNPTARGKLCGPKTAWWSGGESVQ